MTEQELANVQTSIYQLTQQVLSAYYRSQAIIDFVTKKGGLAGATITSVNAYNALVQVVALIDNQATAQGDYLATLTQNLTSPQY